MDSRESDRSGGLLFLGLMLTAMFVGAYAFLYISVLEFRDEKNANGFGYIDAASGFGGDSLGISRDVIIACALDRLGDLADTAEKQLTGGLESGWWDVILANEMRTSYALADALYACIAEQVGQTRGLDVKLLEAVNGAQDEFAPDTSKVFFGTEQLVCYALSFLSIMLIAIRWRKVGSIGAKRLLVAVNLGQDRRIRPEDTYELIGLAENAPKDFARALTIDSLRRFQTTSDLAAAERAIRNGSEDLFNRLMSSITFVRFATWAIPTIGFIGTVRGISDALSRADDPTNLPSIVSFLGSAFDTTLVALLLVLPLMALQFRFTQVLEQRVDECISSLETEIIGRLFVPSEVLRAKTTK